MNPSTFRVRRATVEDMGALKDLWSSMNFPAQDLERKLTEFQVAEDPEGKVVGAVGLEVAQRHGRIHSEGFTDFGLAQQVRPQLWGRIQALALNHGLFRLWTQENSPFYTQNGLTPASEEEQKKLPESWQPISGEWRTLKLKDEEAVASLEKELALFMESERARSEHALNQARSLKMVASIVATIIALAIIAAAIFLWVQRNQIGSPSP